MTTQDERKQRELLDAAGAILVRTAEDKESVSQHDIDEACTSLAEIERDPATKPLGREAAQKLDELNRIRSLPSPIHKDE